MMDITCENCGLVNRGTSRFCARCGQALARPENGQPESPPKAEPTEQNGLDLPWLQTVVDRAAKPLTERLPGDPGQTPDRPPKPVETPQQADPTAAQPPESPPLKGRPTRPTPPPKESPPTQPIEDVPSAGQPLDPNESPPNWVVSILEAQAESEAAPDQDYEPEELAHIMPWVYGEQAGEGIPGAAPDPSTPGSLPPWLGDVTVQETLQSTGEPDTELEPLELGLEGIEPFTPPPDPTAAAVPSAPVEAPDWLGAITGPAERPTPELSMRRADLSQIDVPEDLGFSGPAAGGPVMREIPVRPPREGSVEALAALIGPTAPEAARWTVAGTGGSAFNPKTSSLGARRMAGLMPDALIYILILAALLTVLLVRPPVGDLPAPRASGVQTFYDSIEAVGSTGVVLVVYDWDASRSAEMLLLAEGITRHLMSRRLQFVTISTTPQGPGFAHIVTDRAQKSFQGYEYGRDYVTLGYLPGGHTGLAALISNYRQTLPRDFRDGSYVFTSRSLFANGRLENLDSFALIVTLASDEAELRGWIEQAGTRTKVPMLAALPQGLEPVALPYLNIPGSGLEAVVSGPTGALQYAKLMEQRGLSATGMSATALTDRLGAQSAASLVVALVILASLAGMIVRRRA